MKRRNILSGLVLSAALASTAPAQQAETIIEAPPPTDGDIFPAPAGGAPLQQVAASGETAGAGDGLLTDAELQTLVAPVALYPDTLLIQILVGATAPLDVMKASRFLLEHPDEDEATLKPQIEAQGYDESVEVLAVAFPDVVGEMADHIDWTETVGTAMMAQSDDVLAAVQVLRDQAIDTGALVDTPQQVVSQDPATNTVVIQPADPQVVYVPRYEPDSIWGVGDVVTAGVITWGAVSLIDEIFDDDDDWNDYWGCRNCGGWGGGPIIRDPDIDIDFDGNVNIGDNINIGNRPGLGNGDRPGLGDGDRPGLGGGDRPVLGDGGRPTTLPGSVPEGWRPDPDQAQAARDKIADRREPGGATTLPIQKPTQRDDLRAQLSDRTGAADISRPANRGNLPQIGSGGNGAAAALGAGAAGGALAAGAVRRPGTSDGMAALKGKTPGAKPVTRPATPTRPSAKPQVSRPSASPARVSRPSAAKPSVSRAPIARKSSGSRTRAASARGKGSRSGARRR